MADDTLYASASRLIFHRRVDPGFCQFCVDNGGHYGRLFEGVVLDGLTPALFSVLLRAGADVMAEIAAEQGNRTEASLPGDLADGQIGAQQQRLAFL